MIMKENASNEYCIVKMAQPIGAERIQVYVAYQTPIQHIMRENSLIFLISADTKIISCDLMIHTTKTLECIKKHTKKIGSHTQRFVTFSIFATLY